MLLAFLGDVLGFRGGFRIIQVNFEHKIEQISHSFHSLFGLEEIS
jgi:hypothetical protein